MELKDVRGGVRCASGSSDLRTQLTPDSVLRPAEDIIGKRVQIRAVNAFGSARLLDGLTGTVVALHPIAAGWVKLELDENTRTPHQDWSVALDRLVLVDD